MILIFPYSEMKPRTKLQKSVMEHVKKLSPLTSYQKSDAIKKVALHIVKHRNGEYVCLHCDHHWKDEPKDKITCPECGYDGQVDRTRKRKFTDKAYFNIVTTCGGFQVIRTFLMSSKLTMNYEPDYDFIEIFQKWIAPNGKTCIVGLPRNYGLYVDTWCYNGSFEIREEQDVHYWCTGQVIGQQRIIPELKRNGFTGDYYGCRPNTLFPKLLSDNQIETLWKAGQFRMVDYFIDEPNKLEKHWPQVKIALRHHYTVNRVTIWIDMLHAIEECGKDTRNPKNICPDNLLEAHNRWIKLLDNHREKVRKARERENYLASLKAVADEEQAYYEAKAKFLDLMIKEDELTITPLESVKAFVEEAYQMDHCVFSNKYYKKDDSLILHALIDGQSIATIELSLKSLKVLQCYGAHNSTPPMKDRILQLIDANKNEIARRITA